MNMFQIQCFHVSYPTTFHINVPKLNTTINLVTEGAAPRNVKTDAHTALSLLLTLVAFCPVRESSWHVCWPSCDR